MTESQIKSIARQYQHLIYETRGKYRLPSGQNIMIQADLLIDRFKDRIFFSQAIKDNFRVSKLTKEHLFGKSRGLKDYGRRSRLLTAGIEIAEHSFFLLLVDKTTYSSQGITYFEILGRDSKNLPGKIINVKISEKNNEGKCLFTIVDFKE